MNGFAIKMALAVLVTGGAFWLANGNNPAFAQDSTTVRSGASVVGPIISREAGSQVSDQVGRAARDAMEATEDADPAAEAVDSEAQDSVTDSVDAARRNTDLQ